MNTRQFRISLIALTIAASFLGAAAVVYVDNTSALQNKWVGYFYAKRRSSGNYDYDRVYPGGITYTGGQTQAQIKAQFIADVVGKYDGTLNGHLTVGSAYIIQTMRGVPVGGGTAPDSTAVADWKQRINNPALTVVWATRNTGNQNSGHMINYSGQDDVMRTDGDGLDYTSLVFQIGGVDQYIVKLVCGNPLGALGGLPAAPVDYSLTPKLPSVQTSASAGANIKLLPTVTNSKSAASVGTQWQVSQFFAKVAYPGAGNSTSAPLAYYKNNSLISLQAGSNASYAGNADTPLSAVNATIPDLPVGTVVCYTFSLQPRANDSTEWAHSDPTCVTIATMPLVQVWGGDLSAGKAFLGTTAAVPVANIDTSLTNKTIAGVTYTFGSWVEYGIFASGLTTNIGSAAAYAGTGVGSGLQNASTCNESYLSFHNAVTGKAVCPSGGYSTVGNVSASRSIPDVASSFPVGGSTPQVSNTDVSTMQGVYTSAGDFTLSGATIGAGRWVVINAPSANVTITGNITYTSAALTSINDIPQLIIIAKNINIIDSVTQIDAWLIAKPSPLLADGVINTCSTVAIGAPLSSKICPKPLVVNGPVMANKLYLRRTTSPGVGIDSGNAAETFNLRPDAYLWAATHTASNGRVQTVYTTELPPRL